MMPAYSVQALAGPATRRQSARSAKYSPAPEVWGKLPGTLPLSSASVAPSSSILLMHHDARAPSGHPGCVHDPSRKSSPVKAVLSSWPAGELKMVISSGGRWGELGAAGRVVHPAVQLWCAAVVADPRALARGEQLAAQLLADLAVENAVLQRVGLVAVFAGDVVDLVACLPHARLRPDAAAQVGRQA